MFLPKMENLTEHKDVFPWSINDKLEANVLVCRVNAYLRYMCG